MLLTNPFRFTRHGTPGLLLLAVGRFRLDRRPDDGCDLAATDLLASWFPNGLPKLALVADALESLVVSMAYDRSGSTMGNRAISDLRKLGIPTSVYIRGPLEKATEVVAVGLERAKLAMR